MISKILALVKDPTFGIANNTYVFFSSDNGYHMGDHRLRPGKMTPYETDIHVPLVVWGPGAGVPGGKTVDAIAEEIDVAPTFTAIAGHTAPTQSDGQSLVWALKGNPPPPTWRTMALVEHHGPPDDLTDPTTTRTRARGISPATRPITPPCESSTAARQTPCTSNTRTS
jgi:arylsulfatase A-like enzyme